MKDFVKITEEVYTNCLGQIDSLLTDWVGIIRTGNIADFADSLSVAVINCESPIEQLLAMEMERVGITQINLFNPFIDVLGINNQAQINVDGQLYRVDFLIGVQYKNKNNETTKFVEFAIECDGHEFHQKTKQQVEHDNERTRALLKQGYEVVRFSGTEIWHKAHKCASEILSLILSKCEY